jgi:hypothetical protein
MTCGAVGRSTSGPAAYAGWLRLPDRNQLITHSLGACALGMSRCFGFGLAGVTLSEANSGCLRRSLILQSGQYGASASREANQ